MDTQSNDRKQRAGDDSSTVDVVRVDSVEIVSTPAERGEKRSVRSKPPRRRLNYPTVESLEIAIDAARADCRARNVPLTISRLAWCLGVNRQTLLNYGRREAYYGTIARVRAEIEAVSEERVVTVPKVTRGIMFSLANNYGWREERNVNVVGDPERPITIDAELTDKSVRDLARVIQGHLLAE